MTHNDYQVNSSLTTPNPSTNEVNSLNSGTSIPMNSKEIMLVQGWSKEEIESLGNMGIEAEVLIEVSHIEHFRKFAQFVLVCEEFSCEQKKEKILAYNEKIRGELGRNPDALPTLSLCPDTQAFKDLPPKTQRLFNHAVWLGVPEEELTKVMHVKGFERFLSMIVSLPNPRDERREVILEGIVKALNPPKQKRHRECNKEYIALKRLKGLAYVVENPDISTEEIAAKTEMSRKGVLLALKSLSNSGYIQESSPGLWRACKEGSSHVHSSMRKFLDENYSKYIKYISSKNFQFKNKYPLLSKVNLTINGPASSHIETWQKIIGILKGKGLNWSAPHIRYVLTLYQPRHLLNKIIEVMGNLDIENPGAYLMTVLFNTASKETRIKALDNKALHELNQDVRDAYCKVAQDFGPKNFRYLAYSLRSKHRKGGDVSVGDVQGIAGEIRKKERGIVNRQKPGKSWKKNKKTEKKEQKPVLTPFPIDKNLASIIKESIPTPTKTHEMKAKEKIATQIELGIPFYMNETVTRPLVSISDIMSSMLQISSVS